MFNQQVSDTFWKSQKQYPNYGDIKQRWAHDLLSITKYVPSISKLRDIGCGTGALSAMVCALYGVSDVHLYDISTDLMVIARDSTPEHTQAHLNIASWDEVDYPGTDCCLMMGVLPYMTDDQARRILSQAREKHLILRTPCAQSHEEINKFSENLGSDYSAIYRTVAEVRNLVTPYFATSSVFHSWPRNIDSKFGTRQVTFICTQR